MVVGLVVVGLVVVGLVVGFPSGPRILGVCVFGATFSGLSFGGLVITFLPLPKRFLNQFFPPCQSPLTKPPLPSVIYPSSSSKSRIPSLIIISE